MAKLWEQFGHSRVMSPQAFQYMCGSCGIVCTVLVLVAFIVSGFLPPISPAWSAEQTANHYRDHERGIQAGAALLLISGMSFLPFTAALSAQMRRVPNLHFVAISLQLASGTLGAFFIMNAGILLAVANYRLDRPAEITRALNDLFWLSTFLSWPPYVVQNLTIAYAVVVDSRPKAISPKPMAFLYIVPSILLVPTIAVHCVMEGPLAWNGVFTFWIAGVGGFLPILVDAVWIARAASIEP
jgi:hypothetical protein